MTLFYIYWNKDKGIYMIYPSSAPIEMGTGGHERDFFACFTRMYDAYRYVTRENNPNTPRPYPL